MENLVLNSSREKIEWSAPEVIILESAATAGKPESNPGEGTYYGLPAGS